MERRNLIDLVEGLGYQPVEVLGRQLVLSSSKFDACATAGEVWEQAKRLRELMAGVTDIDPEFAIGPVLDMSSEPPNANFFLELEPLVMKVTMGSPTLSVLPQAGLSEEQLAEWHKRQVEQEYQLNLEAQKAKLVPAFREPRAIKVLQLLKKKPHTGESLYKIYELAEGHPSQRKLFQERFRISNLEFRRFSDAVHNPVVSGNLARHAYEDKPKTPNPMPMAEAQSFVVSLANRWLASLRE